MNTNKNNYEVTPAELYKWLYPNGKFISQRILPQSFNKRYPVLYEHLSKGDLKINIYCYINELDGPPKCKIEECENKVDLISFTKGFRSLCSNECVAAYNRNDPTFGKKVSNAIQGRFNREYYQDKYGDVAASDGNSFILTDGTKVDKGKYVRMKGFNVPDNEESFREYYKDNAHKCTAEYVKTYFPNVYDIMSLRINEFPIHSQLQYMYINKLDKTPLCDVCDTNPVKFTVTNNRFNLTCNEGACRNSSSKFERDIFKFVSESTSLEVLANHRIDNKEIDIYIPELNIGFECNGLYWHSEEHKTKTYHQEKKLHFLDLGINIIMIWEDEWRDKQDLVKSMILSRIGNNIKIYARKTEIRTVSSKVSRKFLNDNHIQGGCVDSYRIGLYYEDELVSLMTFGKRRFINASDTIELIRFCSKRGYSVVGGASKLLSHYIKNHKVDSILSYANLDISDGKLYETLGFDKNGVTAPGYFWTDCIDKFHRSNFMKHKLVEQGYDKDMTEAQIMNSRGFLRIWDAGNIRYKRSIQNQIQ